VHAGVDVVQSVAMMSNPFASEISKQSFSGIENIQGRALGEFDRASESMASLGREEPKSLYGPVPVLRFTPSHSGGVGYPDANPFVNPAPVITYQEPESRQTYEVASGHVLYRTPETGRLSVVRYSNVDVTTSGGDQPDLGEKGCSTTGVGIVTPECEKWRRARVNPFASR
jgi:hypothetical protein